MEKIKKLLIKYKEYVLYIFFGAMTTAVNFIVLYPCMWLFESFGMSDTLNSLMANTVAWICAVAFAFITNRVWVFESKVRGFGPIFLEYLKFAAGRLVSFGIQQGLLSLMIGILKWDKYIVQIPVTIVVLILNYIFSKVFVFRKPNRKEVSSSDENP